VRTVLTDSTYRANSERVREEMETSTGPKHAVELLQRLAVEKQPLHRA
jgi:UDP:flavonoid glycosyltransferase YjiC (YdhE family)